MFDGVYAGCIFAGKVLLRVLRASPPHDKSRNCPLLVKFPGEVFQLPATMVSSTVLSKEEEEESGGASKGPRLPSMIGVRRETSVSRHTLSTKPD